MKPVRRIDHTRAAFARRTRRQTAQQPAHRRVAMDEGVVLGVDELLQAAKDLAVVGGKTASGKRAVPPSGRNTAPGDGDRAYRWRSTDAPRSPVPETSAYRAGENTSTCMRSTVATNSTFLLMSPPRSCEWSGQREGSSSGRNASLMFLVIGQRTKHLAHQPHARGHPPQQRIQAGHQPHPPAMAGGDLPQPWRRWTRIRGSAGSTARPAPLSASRSTKAQRVSI